MDLKDEPIRRNPNPLNVTFYNMKKFYQFNPVIGKFSAQVKAAKLTEQELNQKILDNFRADTLQARLDKLKYGGFPDDNVNGDDDKPGRTPGRAQKKGTLLDDDDEFQRRLDQLRGNIVSPQNTPEQNAKIIQRQNSEKFLNRQLKQEEKELSSLPKGNVRKKRSSIKSSLRFRLPETPPPSFDDYWDEVADQWILHDTTLSGPPEPLLFYYDRDFPPLSQSVLRRHLPPIAPKTPLPPLLQPSTPRETSFISSRRKCFAPM